METLARALSYPIFQATIFADQIGSGFGVSILAIILFVGCAVLCIKKPWFSRRNILLVFLLLLPYVFWYVGLKVSNNAGVGNFIIELCALITIMVSSCVIYKLIITKNFSGLSKLNLFPQSVLMIFVLLFRIFMPFIGK